MSTADELAKLVALRDQGALSDGEFQAEKTRLLGSSPSEGPPGSPPGFVAPPPLPPTGSEAVNGGDDAKKPGGFAVSGKQVLIGLVVVAVIGAATGLGIALTGGSTAAGASEVFLQPTNAQGQNPFTPNVGKDASVPSTVTAALKPTSGTTLASYSGSSVGLYGGTMNLASCDISQMITYLQANPSKASAWAAAEGIPVGQISTYIHGLTPMTLRYDTRVTNHGYVNGVANAIPEILQAGQAVLVDSYGVPRARCYCGNPLTPPVALSGSPRYVGPQWTRFSPTTAIVVQQSTTVINNFTLINNSTGQAFSRPVGTAGTSDAPASACTGPSMPGVTVCTNPTTTSASQAAILSTVQAFYRGYLTNSPSTSFLPTAAQMNLLTQTAVQQIETTGTSQGYDLVTCSQNPLPFSSYLFPTPTVTGSSGAVVVTTNPSTPPYTVSTDVAVGEIGGHWEITSFSCPGITTTVPTTSTTTTSPPTATVPLQTSTGGEFLSPSGNIGCELDYGRTGVADAAECQSFSPPQSVTMSPNGTFTTCTGSDCVGNPGENTPTLAYGQSTGIGPFTCLSAASGITCTVSGRGFQISSSGITAVGASQ